MTDDLLPGILLLTIVAVVSGLARRFGVLRPILLLVVGIGLSYVGGPVDVRLDPEAFLHVLLPLLIFCAARESSLPALRTNLRPVLWLAFGHVVFITLLVGWAVHAVAPAVPLPVAFALGAVVSPPDAIAATAIARRVGLSRRTVSVLEGESLLNDATALVLLRVAVAVVAGAAVSLAEIGLALVYAAVSGVLVGAVLGWAVAWLHERIEDPLLNNTLSILTPFLVFLPAEYVDSSGVVAVVVAALYTAHRRVSGISAASRLQMDAFWRVVQFLLEGSVFVLVGLQIRVVLDALLGDDEPVLLVVATTAVTIGVVVVGRLVWLALGYAVRVLPGLGRVRTMQKIVVLGWAGMRGVITLAAALSLPPETPYRPLVVWIAFVVIVVTLLGQGVTLPWVIRRTGIPGDDRTQDLLIEAEARQEAYRAAVARLDEIVPDDPEYAEVAERLRTLAERRAHRAWERLGDPSKVPPSEIFRRLRLEMLEAERAVLVEARDAGRVPDDVLRRVQRELDLEELMLARGRDEGADDEL